jgi:putative transposase
MALLFNNKYRISSARLQNWNYANEAMYFVTINTKNRKHYFGDIAIHPRFTIDPVDAPCLADPLETPSMASLRPTEIGKIAYSEWHKSMELRPDMNIELGEFVVMPNHIHGIIIIGANQYNRTSAMLGASDSHDGTSDINDDATPRKSAMLGGSGIHDSASDGSDMPDRSYTHDGTSHIHNTASAINRGCGRDAMHGVSTNQFAPQSKNLSSIIRGYKSAVTTFARKNKIEFDWQPLFHEHIIRDMVAYHRISNYIINNPEKWMNETSNKK